MGFPLALLIFSTGIAGLFILNRDKTVRTSPALWLAVTWMWIICSRPVSAWIGGGGGGGDSLDATLEGNSTDAAIFSVLIAIGVFVLIQRGKKTKTLLGVSGPILLFFAYCLVSILWSEFPDAAFKRWIKSIGDLVMVLIILTDVNPRAALERFFTRVGFVLFPASVLLIRYSPLGRGFDPDGNPSNTGVTTNKNTLGMVLFVVSLGLVWGYRTLLRNKGQPGRGRRLVAQTTLLGLCLVLLHMANSATSIACFVLGCAIMFLTNLRAIKRSPAAAHAVVLGIAFTAGLAYALGADEMVVHALGRSTDLTGRKDIWATVLPLAINPIWGAGFQSFWNSVHSILRHNAQIYMFKDLSTAHNGYIEVYLNLGWVGLGFLGLILITGYMRAARAFHRDPDLGGLILAYIATAVVYDVTEAGFRMMTPIWILFLVSIVAAGAIAAGAKEMLPGQAPEPVPRRVKLVASTAYDVAQPVKHE